MHTYEKIKRLHTFLSNRLVNGSYYFVFFLCNKDAVGKEASISDPQRECKCMSCVKAGEIQGTCQKDEEDMLLKFPIEIIQGKLLNRTQRGENHELARFLSAVCQLSAS